MMTVMRGFILSVMLLAVPSANTQDVKRSNFLHSKHFWVRMGIVGTAWLGDVWSSQNVFARNPKFDYERNPIYCGFKCQPSAQRMIAIGAPFEFGLAFGSYKMSRSNHAFIRHTSWVPVILDVGDELYWTNYNFRSD
jgi:hypothetical protein